MELFLIVVLAIAFAIAWNSTRDAFSSTRNTIDQLQREVDFLRSQLAAFVSSTPKTEEPKAAPAAPHHQTVCAAVSTQPASVRTVSQTAHSVPPPVAPFTVPPPPKPVDPPSSAKTPVGLETQPTKPAAPVLADSKPVQPTPAQGPRPEPIAPKTPDPQARPEQPSPQPAPAQPRQPQAPSQPHSQPIAAFRPETEAARARLTSLEQTLGANWLGKIGVASLVIGIASFLAWKLQTWGPGGKVLCGFAVSAILLGGGGWLERKPTYRIFARGGIGGGWALAYFTTFAAYHLQAARVLGSLPVDLALMLLVAAGMVGHSLLYRSQTVTSLAFMLGFGTLLTSHIENPTETVVFSLAASAILAVALVVVTTLRHWAVLELCGLIAVYVSHFVWLNEVLPQQHSNFAEFWPSTALILLYWIIFRLAYVLRTPLDKREEDLSSISAIFNSAGVLGVLKFQSAHPEWAFWALVVLGAIEMSLAWWARSKRRQAFIVLSTIAVVLLVSSVPFRFHGVSWPVLWLVQAQILAIAGLRLGEPIFRRLGLLVGVITGGVLAFHDVMPLAIERLVASDTSHHWSLTAGLALAAMLYWTHSEIYPRRWPAIANSFLESLALRICSWLALGAAAACLWVVLPNQWLPTGWLALFLILIIAGHCFRAVNLLFEGDILALASAGVLAFNHVLPLAFFRLTNADPGAHPAETAVFALAALALWFRSEVFPRLLPSISSDASPVPALSGWLAFILPCTSWLALASAAASMWVAMPDQWLPLGWIALFLILVVAGHLFHASMPPLEGDILALAAAGVLAFHHLFPLLAQRMDATDSGHHLAETAIFSLTALALWMRGHLFPRILPKLLAQPGWDPASWESVMLPISSCIGTASAAAAIWIALPSHWVPVGWLLLVLALGFAADWLVDAVLALQADSVAILSLFGLAVWDLNYFDWDHRFPPLICLALLYCGMHRKTSPRSHNYVPAAYSWAAAGLLPFITYSLLNHDRPWFAPVLTGLCIILFEIGRLFRKGFLRWQGYALVAIAYVMYIGSDLPLALFRFPSPPLDPNFTLVGSCLLEVLILLAAGFWLHERTRPRAQTTDTEHIIGLFANSIGLFCLVIWIGIRFPLYISSGEAWIAPLWAAIATTLLSLAWLIRRRVFLVQATCLAICSVLRGLLFDLLGASHEGFWSSTLFHLSVTALILLAAQPFAFKLRHPRFWESNPSQPAEPFASALRFPEQVFFFAPFAMMVIALAVKLTSGHITIAWSLLGLGTFLFALIVGERSFRLAGLGLLLISVSKIVLIDIWKLSTPDRFMTLIILGAALIAVSFLYTRFSSTIRKYL